MDEKNIIIVGPFWTNVIDLVGRDDLVTKNGGKITIIHGYRFTVLVDGKEIYYGDDNLQASAALNSVEVHVK